MVHRRDEEDNWWPECHASDYVETFTTYPWCLLGFFTESIELLAFTSTICFCKFLFLNMYSLSFCTFDRQKQGT